MSFVALQIFVLFTVNLCCKVLRGEMNEDVCNWWQHLDRDVGFT